MARKLLGLGCRRTRLVTIAGTTFGTGFVAVARITFGTGFVAIPESTFRTGFVTITGTTFGARFFTIAESTFRTGLITITGTTLRHWSTAFAGHSPVTTFNAAEAHIVNATAPQGHHDGVYLMKRKIGLSRNDSSAHLAVTEFLAQPFEGHFPVSD